VFRFFHTLFVILPMVSGSMALADFEFFRGVRQMGMGGASIAVVNDETALLSNPNGLGRLRDQITTVFDPELTGSTHSLKPVMGTGGLGFINPQTLYDALDGTQSRPSYFKSQFFPSIVMPNFGIGLLGRHEVLGIRNLDGTYDYRYQNDYSLNVGYNLSFWGGRIKVGFAGRMINRVEYFGERDPSVDSLALDDFANEGMGIAMDTGITLAAPWAMIPTLTLYVRDVGGTSFNFGPGFFGNNKNGAPELMSQTMDLAVALFPIFDRDSRGVLTVEYTGIDSMSEVESHMDRLRIGGELNLWDAYFFRAGYHAQTWTAGLEYANDLIQWQLASYAEMVPTGGEFYRDRRAVVKFALRF
jgi:hypothetical protein